MNYYGLIRIMNPVDDTLHKQCKLAATNYLLNLQGVSIRAIGLRNVGPTSFEYLKDGNWELVEYTAEMFAYVNPTTQECFWRLGAPCVPDEWILLPVNIKHLIPLTV